MVDSASVALTKGLFMELLQPMELYNLLNQSFEYPSVSDPSYLLLIDARKLHEYNESHIVTAKQAPQDAHNQFVVPFDAELECKQYVVVYDGTTDSLDNIDTSAALQCAKLLADKGSRNPVRILAGGYERFSALYPFLRTQKILWLPQELDDIKTYPLELIPGLLYLGNGYHGNAEHVKKDLKIRGKIACCVNGENQTEEGQDYMKIPILDDNDADIKQYLSKACAFIDTHRDKKSIVLVYSDLGYSRAVAVCIAYLMHCQRNTLQECYTKMKQCNVNACPNTGFLHQLEQWYTETIGSVIAEV